MFDKKNVKMIIIVIGIIICIAMMVGATTKLFEDNEIEKIVSQILDDQNIAYLNSDRELLKYNYDIDALYGKWAYEYAEKKMNYLNDWSEKQGIEFTKIKSDYIFYNIEGSSQIYNVTVKSIDEYSYKYNNEKDSKNTFKIAVYHYMRIENKEDIWMITKDWFSDPMCENLCIDNDKLKEITEYLSNCKSKDYKLIDSREKAIKYADKYCGATKTSKYNKNYRNYNSVGGDCANFTSQIIYEGGFNKNSIWNYDNGGSLSWIKSENLVSYLLYNGRGSKIAVGSYDKIYQHVYKLQPGDLIAYAEKGEIKHVSVVAGYDSKGYPLVNCHNIDRYRVPWDIGWNREGVTYWLVSLNYN